MDVIILGTIQILRNQDFDPFGPTHTVCHQTLLIKQTNFMLFPNPLAYPTHQTLLITWPIQPTQPS